MRPKEIVKRWVENVTHTHITRVLPHGVDLFSDLSRLLPDYSPATIFDVGANIGQTSEEFEKHFPSARVYSFEPVASTFQLLNEKFRRNTRVTCYELALGASEGTAEMATTGGSEMFYLRNLHPQFETGEDLMTQHVAVVTIDNFCRGAGIDNVGYLKIDTEGGDLDVLIGATRMLESHRVQLVQVEAGMNPDNERHVPLEEFRTFLEPRGYRLFGLYEQVHEWPVGQPFLRRTNPVFLSESLTR